MNEILIHTIMVQTNAHKYIEFNLYIQWASMYFGQTCGHLQECKIQKLDTLKV